MTDFPNFYIHIAPPKPDVIRFLRGQGVSIDALAEPELPAFAEVSFHEGQPLFDFADGDGALIFLARDEEGDPCDLVAWSAKKNRLAAWYGDAPLLGAEAIYAPRLDPENALKVHETALLWLLAVRDGVVIVDPKRAAPILRAAEPLKASSAAFGLRLRDLIAPRRPRIFVPQGRAA